MKIEATLGEPTENGIYAARQWYGWRILEWDGAKWWHPGRSAPWPVGERGDTGIEAHFGPLPTISKDFTQLPPHRGIPKTLFERMSDQMKPPVAQEYDL